MGASALHRLRHLQQVRATSAPQPLLNASEVHGDRCMPVMRLFLVLFIHMYTETRTAQEGHA